MICGFLLNQIKNIYIFKVDRINIFSSSRSCHLDILHHIIKVQGQQEERCVREARQQGSLKKHRDWGPPIHHVTASSPGVTPRALSWERTPSIVDHAFDLVRLFFFLIKFVVIFPTNVMRLLNVVVSAVHKLLFYSHGFFFSDIFPVFSGSGEICAHTLPSSCPLWPPAPSPPSRLPEPGSLWVSALFMNDKYVPRRTTATAKLLSLQFIVYCPKLHGS